MTSENLAGLGAERLADILVQVAETRPDLKRRLRMELAAEQGTGPLANEIDKRLAAFETSRGKVGWRQKPAFLRDLDALRELIAVRLAGHDVGAAAERLWGFMETARQVGSRLREREDVSAIFRKAAADLGRLMASQASAPLAEQLVDAVLRYPSGWTEWLPSFLAEVEPAVAAEALERLKARASSASGRLTLLRQLADAAGDATAYRETYTAAALAAPHVAADVARRFLAAGAAQEAGAILQAAAPKPSRFLGKKAEPDPEWEDAWIDYLEQSGQKVAAQDARWAAFERSLSAEHARAFIQRLPDFEDVEAEARAFELAARHADFERGLGFLVEWPNLGEAGRMILARPDDIQVDPELAELWAAKLRRRNSEAAHLLLRKAAAAAFRRRDYKASDRLTQEADSIGVG